MAQQGILLDRLLRPLSAKTLSSEQRRGLLSERNHPERSAPAARRPRAARTAKTGINETCHGEMNQKIDRMSRQLSCDSITAGTLAKYKSGWGHWSLFYARRIQADGTVYGSWLPGADRERVERQIVDYITYEGFFANGGNGWATSTRRCPR